jgi:hypothetical protein
MEVSGQLHVPASLPPGKEPLYPLDRRLGGPYSRSGRGGEEKNSQLHLGSHKHGNESACSIKGGEFLDQMIYYQLLKKGTARWAYGCTMLLSQRPKF